MIDKFPIIDSCPGTMTHDREKESPDTKKLQRRQQRNQQRFPTGRVQSFRGVPVEIESSEIISTLPSSPPPMASSIRVLVCSIGNPGAYINTLHSAGHTVVSSLAPSLGCSSFQKSRAYGNGLVSHGMDYTLWQSSSLMNVSGVGLSAAWKQFLRDRVGPGEEGKLVVVHDELESALGVVKTRDGALSHKGHNGLKSIREKMPAVSYTRIGVGIGRPVSRAPNAVADYVLRKMTPGEKAKIEGCVGRVLDELDRIRAA
jgi:PTH1 family peptidyl-tRNA hydrolase